jgi:CHAD domain-containing protein
MPPKTDESILVYGAGVLLKQTAAIQQEVEGVRQEQDIEYIHRMRVASRRLRTAFDLFNACLPKKKAPVWQKQIQQVTHALGAARDTDVQIDLVNKLYKNLPGDRYKPGISRLLLRLRQRRAKLQVAVLDALKALEAGQTLVEMEHRLRPAVERTGQIYLYSPSLFELSFNAISARLDAFLAYEGYIDKPECVTELHAMRICAKHLRYALEAFAPLYRQEMQDTLQVMRKVQDELGEIHDSDVWTDSLPKFIEKERQRTLNYYGNNRLMSHLLPGLEFFGHDRRENREAHYQAFLAYWQTLKADETWGKLRETIQMPFNLGQAREMLTPEDIHYDPPKEKTDPAG